MLAFLLTGFCSISFAQIGSKLLKKLEAAPPGEGEAIVKLYSDKARTTEITSISDGTTDLYFRAFIWKDKTKRGDTPYAPMESDYCFEFVEGEFESSLATNGFDYADVKSKVDSKSMKSYVATKDYIDIDVNLKETQFLDYFVRDAEVGKKHKFTARLEGECKFFLAHGVFEFDLVNGKDKYEELLLASNADIEIPDDIYKGDQALHEQTKKIIASTYGEKGILNVYFYAVWETASSKSERYTQAAFTTKTDGKCYMSYVRVWCDRDYGGGWLPPSAANQRSTNQINCSKLE